jgi:hypothetical protein
VWRNYLHFLRSMQININRTTQMFGPHLLVDVGVSPCYFVLLLCPVFLCSFTLLLHLTTLPYCFILLFCLVAMPYSFALFPCLIALCYCFALLCHFLFHLFVSPWCCALVLHLVIMLFYYRALLLSCLVVLLCCINFVFRLVTSLPSSLYICTYSIMHRNEQFCKWL